MNNRTETDKKSNEERSAPKRRPWHAPQFIATDLAATDAVGNAGSDGGPMGSFS